MKTLLIALISVIFFLPVVLSQRTFAPLNAEWKYEHWSDGSGWEGNWEGNCYGNHRLLRVDSEILIDNRLCAVIQQYRIPNDGGDLIKRNDSLIVWNSGDTVFFYEENQFYPLLIFQGEVGDTLRTYRPKKAESFSVNLHWSDLYDTVDEILSLVVACDTIMIEGTSRRRWVTESIWDYYEGPCWDYRVIVKGIGSMWGLIGSNCWVIADGCFGGFVCYTDTLLQLGSDWFSGCEFLTSVQDIIKSAEINIYPNPTRNVIHIENKSDHAFDKIAIWSLDGRILQFNQYESAVNLDDQPPGIYIVELRTPRGLIYFERIVKL